MTEDLRPLLAATTHSTTQPRNILVVDDDLEASKAIAHMIRSLGHHAVTCTSAHTALNILRDAKIDLMLVDYRMPEMTGLDLLSLLREENHLVPAIMMTGYLATQDRLLSVKSELAGILTKPIVPSLLGDAIGQGLRGDRTKS